MENPSATEFQSFGRILQVLPISRSDGQIAARVSQSVADRKTNAAAGTGYNSGLSLQAFLASAIRSHLVYWSQSVRGTLRGFADRRGRHPAYGS